MITEAISLIPQLDSLSAAVSVKQPSEKNPTVGFSETMRTEFSSANDKLLGAEHALRELAAGKQTNLHHVMIALEDAKMSFQLLVQVRNKVLDAYQELLRTQV
jgi:flagellar hook-basal body complex protein FliE